METGQTDASFGVIALIVLIVVVGLAVYAMGCRRKRIALERESELRADLDSDGRVTTQDSGGGPPPKKPV